MRRIIISLNMAQDLIYNAYLPESSNQIGGDLPFFVGKQYGSGWLGTLARVAFPILKRLAGFASNAAEDVIYHDKPVVSAIADQAKTALDNFVKPSSINTSGKRQKGTRKTSTSSYPLFQRKRARK